MDQSSEILMIKADLEKDLVVIRDKIELLKEKVYDKEYVIQWIRMHEKIHEEQLRALDAAFEAAREKSEAHNNLIHAMERQTATFVTQTQYGALREGYEAAIKQLIEKTDGTFKGQQLEIGKIENQLSNYAGRITMMAFGWGLFVIIFSSLVAWAFSKF